MSTLASEAAVQAPDLDDLLTDPQTLEIVTAIARRAAYTWRARGNHHMADDVESFYLDYAVRMATSYARRYTPRDDVAWQVAWRMYLLTTLKQYGRAVHYAAEFGVKGSERRAAAESGIDSLERIRESTTFSDGGRGDWEPFRAIVPIGPRRNPGASLGGARSAERAADRGAAVRRWVAGRGEASLAEIADHEGVGYSRVRKLAREWVRRGHLASVRHGREVRFVAGPGDAGTGIRHPQDPDEAAAIHVALGLFAKYQVDRADQAERLIAERFTQPDLDLLNEVLVAFGAGPRVYALAQEVLNG